MLRISDISWSLYRSKRNFLKQTTQYSKQILLKFFYSLQITGFSSQPQILDCARTSYPRWLESTLVDSSFRCGACWTRMIEVIVSEANRYMASRGNQIVCRFSRRWRQITLVVPIDCAHRSTCRAYIVFLCKIACTMVKPPISSLNTVWADHFFT